MGSTSLGLPTSGSGSTNGGDFLGDLLNFETFHGGNILKKIGDDPSRLLTGIDPASTDLWNGVLGTTNKPIVDQMGGATGDDYAKASQAGINTTAGHDTQDLAHVVAGIFAGQGLSGIGGGSAGDASSLDDDIDAGGGWSPSTGADLGDDIDAGGGWSPVAGADTSGDDIDAGGGWNPASGGANSSSGLTSAQKTAIGNALRSLGKQSAQKPSTFAMQSGQRWNPQQGAGFVSPTSG